MKNSNTYKYSIRFFIFFAVLMITVPGFSHNGSMAFDEFALNHTSADTTVINRTGNFKHLSSPRLRRPATLRSKKHLKRFSIKRSGKTPAFKKKRFVNTRHHHRKELYALLGNAVEMKDLHFRLNALTPAAADWKTTLDSVLQPYINGTEAYDSILVVGYTDNTGSRQRNLQLSAQRAKNIAAFLQEKGIAESRIHIMALGEDYPAVSNTTRQGRDSNRRVEINFLKGG